MTTRQVELIRKKEFPAAALDLKYEAFVVDIATLNVNSDDEVHPSKKAQIAYVKVDKASTQVMSEYADFADIFSPKLAAELLKHGRKDHVIEFVDD